MISNLKDKYLGRVVNRVSQGAKEIVTEAISDVSDNAFNAIFTEKQAELPPQRTLPNRPDDYTPPTLRGDYNTVSNNDENNSDVYVEPSQSFPKKSGKIIEPYIPPKPIAAKYNVDEKKMRQMAQWKATTNLKYIQIATGFLRSILGNIAATNAMVAMLEKYESEPASMTEEELEMMPTIEKAVAERRRIEQTRGVILEDEDMRSIYEELIYQEMYDQNERGELVLQKPDSFIINYMILSSAEVLEAAKDTIGEKVSGGIRSLKQKMTKKR